MSGHRGKRCRVHAGGSMAGKASFKEGMSQTVLPAMGALLLALASVVWAEPAVEPAAVTAPAVVPPEQKPQTPAAETPAAQPVSQPAAESGIVPEAAKTPAPTPQPQAVEFAPVAASVPPADVQPPKEPPPPPARTETAGSAGGNEKAGVSETSHRKIRDTIRKLDELLRR